LQRYTINNVERLTGLNAHSLRAWEKRYKTLIPHRTETNIRYYDDEQLRKLLNIAALLPHGYRISALMGMSDEELHALILEIQQPRESGEPSLEAHINNMVAAMLAFDEPLFDKVVSNAIIRLGVHNAVLKVIYPFLWKTGVLWSIDNATPAQEHFASNILKRKLQSAIDGIPYPSGRDDKIVLFLPPDEQHEIGLLFSDYLLRQAGKPTIYLGQNLPYATLRPALEKIGARHLLTFFTAARDMRKHLSELTAILKETDRTLLICSKEPCPSDLPLPANIKFLSTPADLLYQIQ
jgi:DNA-binding transcriptional MerR regulator